MKLNNFSVRRYCKRSLNKVKFKSNVIISEGVSLFNSDIPIKHKKDDLFDRYNFVENLCDSITNYDSKEGLVIGLMGEWGSGKSSILKMTEFHLKENSKNNNILIFYFNPWNFSDQENLISQFFIELENKLRESGNFSKNTLKSLKKMAIKFIPLATSIMTRDLVSTGVMEKILERIGVSNNNIETLSEIKNRLNDDLLNSNHKIVIFIDEIDRLTDYEVKEIFRLVNSVADFPNVIYVLSFDKDMVISSLSDVQSNNPEKFMEKIIQIPATMPKISDMKLQNIINNELKVINGYEKLNYNRRTKLKILLKPFFNNMRDIKRYINTLKFYMNTIEEKVYIFDFLILVALQIFEPNIYKGIKDNKDLFVNTNLLNIIGLKPDYSKKRKYFDSIVKQKRNIKNEEINEILSELFPEYKNSFSEEDGKMVKCKERRKKICNYDNFDTYFKLSFDSENIISFEIWDFILNATDYQDIVNLLFSLNNEKLIPNFINQLHSRISDLPYELIKPLITSFLISGEKISNNYPQSNLNYQIVYIINELLKRVSDCTDRKDILNENLEMSDDNVIMMTRLLSSYDDKNVSDTNSSKIKSNNILYKDLNELIEKLLPKLNILIKSELEDNNLNLSDVIFYWSKWSNGSEKEIINEIFSNPYTLSNFLKNFMDFEQQFNISLISRITNIYELRKKIDDSDYVNIDVKTHEVIKAFSRRIKRFT